MHKAWAENVIKNIDGAYESTQVLSTLGKIIYSQGCSLDGDPIAWAKKQIEILANVYANAPRFMEYLKKHWLPKANMWCVGNRNIPHIGQDTNSAMESFHSNMKGILYSSRKKFIGHRMD